MKTITPEETIAKTILHATGMKVDYWGEIAIGYACYSYGENQRAYVLHIDDGDAVIEDSLMDTFTERMPVAEGIASYVEILNQIDHSELVLPMDVTTHRIQEATGLTIVRDWGFVSENIYRYSDGESITSLYINPDGFHYMMLPMYGGVEDYEDKELAIQGFIRFLKMFAAEYD